METAQLIQAAASIASAMAASRYGKFGGMEKGSSGSPISPSLP